MRLFAGSSFMSLKPYFKSCMFCGSVSVFRVGFCKFCFNEIQKRVYAPQVLVVKGMLVRPLFLWNEINSQWLRHLIYCLKSGDCKREQSVLAELFLEAYLPKHKNIDFYCAPGGESDHAEEWSYAITQKLDSSFQRPFLKNTSRQKEKTRNERGQIDISLNSIVVRKEGVKKAIFLDDVLATGSTAYKSLNLLEDYLFKEAWCIAYKEHCSRKRPLL